MTNPQRLLQIADHIEAEPETFDMKTLLNPCGTVGCIAGQAIMLFGDPQEIKRQGQSSEGVAANLLNLNLGERRELFFAESLDGEAKDPYDGERYFIEGYRRIDNSCVPAVLRWMTTNSCYNWGRAFDALGLEPRD